MANASRNPQKYAKDEEDKLKNAGHNTLQLASHQSSIQSLAMPAISAGICGFPKELCASIIVQGVISFLNEHTTSLREIAFFLMDDIIGLFIDNIEKLTEGG